MAKMGYGGSARKPNILVVKPCLCGAIASFKENWDDTDRFRQAVVV